MKTKPVLLGALLLFAVTGVADAANLMAGPLYPTSPDGIACKILNISGISRPVTIQVMGANGDVLIQGGLTVLKAGRTTVVGGPVTGPAYCKFIGATSVSFRASITSFNTVTGGTDFVALPAR